MWKKTLTIELSLLWLKYSVLILNGNTSNLSFWPITNMQNSAPVILKVKICKETYSWFFKKMSQWLAETHKKSFLLKKWIFFTFKSHKIACELAGHNPRVKCIFHKQNVMFWEHEISCKTCITTSHATNTKLTI